MVLILFVSLSPISTDDDVLLFCRSVRYMFSHVMFFLPDGSILT